MYQAAVEHQAVAALHRAGQLHHHAAAVAPAAPGSRPGPGPGPPGGRRHPGGHEAHYGADEEPAVAGGAAAHQGLVPGPAEEAGGQAVVVPVLHKGKGGVTVVSNVGQCGPGLGRRRRGSGCGENAATAIPGRGKTLA
jgi:hypothetical protein